KHSQPTKSTTSCKIPPSKRFLSPCCAHPSGKFVHPPPLSSSQVRLANAGIKRNIISIPGAYDYLISAGFRRVVTDYEEHLTFSPSPSPTLLHKLRCANFVLKDVKERAVKAEEREKRFRESEMEAEKERVGKVMLGFEEDRRLKREKDERDKIVRDSKARKAAELAAALPDHPILHSGPSDAASTMEVSRYDDEDMDEGEDAPPSYGQLHGRVLGTGEAVNVPAPRGVRMVNAQDEEDSGDDGGLAD
ncbi:hypothetical protein P7C70_g7634, partial [Phenoliferia sp. Uapishka_3]